MPEPSTGHVFMSYSRRDDAVMQRITTFLRQQGINVWVDNEKLVPGTPVWEKEIEKAIQNASAVIVVLSPDSKDSEWVRREINLADQHGKRVFPVLVRGDEKASISLRLIGRQYVDIRTYEEAGLNYVSASILRYLQELDAQEQNTRKEAARVAAQKTRTEKRLAKQKADEERIAREKNTGQVFNLIDENQKQLAAQKAEEERIAREKAEHLAAHMEEEKRIAREKEELKRRNAEIYNRSRESAAKTTQALLSKLKIPTLVLVIGVVGYFLWQGISSLIPVAPDATNTPTATMTLAPTKTKTPTPTKILTPTPTLEPEPGAIMTGKKGEALVYVPKGEFTMGSKDFSDTPVHTVYLDAFWIDQFEVTNKQYQACVDAGKCEPPSSKNSYTHPSYYENPDFDNYPVLYVTWDQANRYCEVWAGGDLPTEAQWEKAARGTEAFTYPWGNEAPNTDLLNYNQNVGDTNPVGSYESGKSPYNAYDMVGNVWEWVNDYYQSDYYALLGDNASNPQGPTSSDYRVLRGGAWVDFGGSVRSTNRSWNNPALTNFVIGFRCSRSP